MPRKLCQLCWSEEAGFHIFKRGQNRETVLHDDDGWRYFLELCNRYRDRFGQWIYYCLMDNQHEFVYAM